jgi:hypothetical protein
MTLLNPDQARRLDTHLSLLAADLDALAAAPEFRSTFTPATGIREAVAATSRAADELRLALELPAAPSPSFKHRVGAVAAVWAARVDDLRADRLRGYGAVHPNLASHLDAGVNALRRSLERLADAAGALP